MLFISPDHKAQSLRSIFDPPKLLDGHWHSSQVTTNPWNHAWNHIWALDSHPPQKKITLKTLEN